MFNVCNGCWDNDRKLNDGRKTEYDGFWEHHMPLSIHGGGVKIPFRQHVYVYSIDQVVAELAIPLIRALIHEL